MRLQHSCRSCATTNTHSRRCAAWVAGPCPSRRSVLPRCSAQKAPDTPGQQAPGSSPAVPTPAAGQQQQEQRLFSNLNPRTLKHEPGTVAGAALLIAGTTVGAGILALPEVTAAAGFAPSVATLTTCCAFSIITGLLVAEVNINTLCEVGAGSGVSINYMAGRTLGPTGAAATSAAYIFLHYALLVAYISKAAAIVAQATGVGMVAAGVGFTAGLGGVCYGAGAAQMDALNGALVVAVVGTFVGLLVAAAPGVDPAALTIADWSVVAPTVPVIALAFVYHNVVPVVVSNLECDIPKIRTAIISGVLIPYVMFVSWEAAILGSVGLTGGQPAGQLSGQTEQTAAALLESSPVATATAGAQPRATTSSYNQQQQQQQQQATAGAEWVAALPEAPQQPPGAAAADAGMWLPPQLQAWSPQATTLGQLSSLPSAPPLHAQVPSSNSSSSSSNHVDIVYTSRRLSSSSLSSSQPLALTSDSSSSLQSTPSTSTSTSTRPPAAADPLAVLSSSTPVVAPLIQGFSFLAIATSFIGFILGLTDFLADVLSLPSGRQAPLPYGLTLLPPLGLALSYPGVFLEALDAAGTYGVLTLFGVLPAAMAWSERYGDTTLTKTEIVPGGRLLLLVVGGSAAAVIAKEASEALLSVLGATPGTG